MDRAERLRQLLALVRDEYCDGNQAALARALEKDATYINRLFWGPEKNGAKGIGPAIMEACSAKFGLPVGFWEMSPDDARAALHGRPGAAGQLAGNVELLAAAKEANDTAWPYARVDLAKLSKLSGADARALENAMLAAAGDIGVDIRKGNRRAA